jgi:hypothetical protein
VDVSLENALVHHFAQDVLRCFWIGDTKGQPVEISADPPDSYAGKNYCSLSLQSRRRKFLNSPELIVMHFLPFEFLDSPLIK